MKIAICLNKVQPRDGTSHFATQLGQMLMAAGHEITLVAGMRSQPHELAHLPRGMAYMHTRPGRWDSKARDLANIGRLFQRAGFDVVFVCLGVPPRHLADFLHRLPDATAIVPIVGTDRLFAYDPLVNSAAAWNVAVAESPRLMDEIHARVPGKAVRLLTTGVPHPTDKELATRLPHGKPLRLLFVGRLAGRKNVLMLPAILVCCRRRGVEVTLTVCGHGPDHEPLVEACRAAGVAHLVDFPDVPEQTGLYETYRQHHVLLLTSSYGEGLGLVLLEAQANGCVPVASRLQGVFDFAIDAGETGLLAEIKNADNFAEQIATLTTPDRWQKLSRAGVARTRNLFTYVAMSRDYVSLLADLERGDHALPRPRSTLARPPLRWTAQLPPPVLERYVRLLPRLQPAVPPDPDPE
ncbi:MAG: glycosyltransferase family 4 protein [Cyanobacteria bacterium]|nr:glycosyltransferase family 4 protein [Cyanobacteriota bacterium]